jgi:hypothetical protein
MHDYSVRGHARERQIYLLAAVAFSVMPLLTSLSGWIGVSISIGTATIFGIVFWLFDRLVWRWWPVRKALGFCDLNGKWNVTGQRLNSDGTVANEWTAALTIVQTWSRISVVLTTGQSISRSGPASLTCEDGIGHCLLYTYMNDPEPNQPNLKIHRGTCELRFANSCSEATGVYFNDQHRLTFGRMKLTKQEPIRKESR